MATIKGSIEHEYSVNFTDDSFDSEQFWADWNTHFGGVNSLADFAEHIAHNMAVCPTQSFIEGVGPIDGLGNITILNGQGEKVGVALLKWGEIYYVRL